MWKFCRFSLKQDISRILNASATTNMYQNLTININKDRRYVLYWKMDPCKHKCTSLNRDQKFGKDFRVAANFWMHTMSFFMANCTKMNETKHEICDESFYDSKVLRDFLP